MLQAITCDCKRLHVQFKFEIYMIFNHLCEYDAINCSFILQNGWHIFLSANTLSYIQVIKQMTITLQFIWCGHLKVWAMKVYKKPNSCIKVFFVVHMLEYFYLKFFIWKINLKTKFQESYTYIIFIYLFHIFGFELPNIFKLNNTYLEIKHIS
jgi:hypothetical protein